MQESVFTSLSATLVFRSSTADELGAVVVVSFSIEGTVPASTMPDMV